MKDWFTKLRFLAVFFSLTGVWFCQTPASAQRSNYWKDSPTVRQPYNWHIEQDNLPTTFQSAKNLLEKNLQYEELYRMYGIRLEVDLSSFGVSDLQPYIDSLGAHDWTNDEFVKEWRYHSGLLAYNTYVVDRVEDQLYQILRALVFVYETGERIKCDIKKVRIARLTSPHAMPVEIVQERAKCKGCEEETTEHALIVRMRPVPKSKVIIHRTEGNSKEVFSPTRSIGQLRLQVYSYESLHSEAIWTYVGNWALKKRGRVQPIKEEIMQSSYSRITLLERLGGLYAWKAEPFNEYYLQVIGGRDIRFLEPLRGDPWFHLPRQDHDEKLTYQEIETLVDKYIEAQEANGEKDEQNKAVWNTFRNSLRSTVSGISPYRSDDPERDFPRYVDQLVEDALLFLSLQKVFD